MQHFDDLSSRRRLCPDLAFFQSATAHPCMDDEQRVNCLRKRVEQSVLKYQDISKNRMGITIANVSLLPHIPSPFCQ